MFDFEERISREIFPNKPRVTMKRIIYFILYLIRSPFDSLIYNITNLKEFFLNFKKPTFWIKLWAICLSVYMIWFWGKPFVFNHLILWLTSFIAIMVWYVWAKGDWVNYYRQLGKEL